MFYENWIVNWYGQWGIHRMTQMNFCQGQNCTDIDSDMPNNEKLYF